MKKEKQPKHKYWKWAKKFRKKRGFGSCVFQTPEESIASMQLEMIEIQSHFRELVEQNRWLKARVMRAEQNIEEIASYVTAFIIVYKQEHNIPVDLDKEKITQH